MYVIYSVRVLHTVYILSVYVYIYIYIVRVHIYLYVYSLGRLNTLTEHIVTSRLLMTT